MDPDQIAGRGRSSRLASPSSVTEESGETVMRQEVLHPGGEEK